MTLPTAEFFRLQYTLHSASGDAKDDIVSHTYYYNTTFESPLSEANHTIIAEAWGNLVTPGEPSSTLAGTRAWKVYNMTHPEPRYPVFEGTQSSFSPGVDTLPREVALVISWKPSEFVSGQKASRQRGRTYIGPFRTAMASSSTGRPNSTKVNDLAVAAVAYLTAVHGVASGAVWPVIYSAGVGSRRPDGTYRPNWTPFLTHIRAGWVDDEWDTQRSRGRAPTTRTTFGPMPW